LDDDVGRAEAAVAVSTWRNAWTHR
jgi:hypothetical protein